MSLELRHRSSASELSEGWDELAGSYFQQRGFLLYSERYNPCEQRYYELLDGDSLVGGAAAYTLRLDLLTFARIRSPVRFSIVGVPASISSPGLIGGRDSMALMLPWLYEAERGLVLLLNLPPGLSVEPAVGMRMMPTVVLRHDFASWDEYVRALRSPYRRRMRKNEAAFRGVSVQVQPCSRFDDEMFALYLQVMARTTTKLEVLSLEYFRNLPEAFTLTTCSLDGRVIAWHINLQEGQRLTFFYGGTDDAFRDDRRAYHNNLAGILREAIEGGCSEIDLGQTAEIAKTRLGGALEDKDMAAYHRSAAVRLLLRLGRRALQYDRSVPAAHVFKQAEGSAP